MSGYLYGLQGENFYHAATLEGVSNQETLIGLAEENNYLQQELISEQRATRNTMLQLHYEQEASRLREKNFNIFSREFESQGYSPLDAAKLANLEVSLLGMPSMVEFELSKFKERAEHLIEKHKSSLIKANNFRYGLISGLMMVSTLIVFYFSFKGKPEPSLTGLILFMSSWLLILVYLIKGVVAGNRIKKLKPEEFNDSKFENLLTSLKTETVSEIDKLISFIKPPGGSRLYDYSNLLSTLEYFRAALVQGE